MLQGAMAAKLVRKCVALPVLSACQQTVAAVCPSAQSNSQKGYRSLAFEAALPKSCVDSQLKRLQSVGYSNSALVGVVHALLQKAKGHVHQRSPDLSKQKPVVLPYVRRVTHNLKKVAERSLWHFPPLANLAACAHKF